MVLMIPNGPLNIAAELDARFPTGRWKGWWRQDLQRAQMELDLTFARGRIHGDGRDCVGDFVLSGHYCPAAASCSLLKSYLGQHDVDYDGIVMPNGIRGTWIVRDRETKLPVDTGSFHIWPARDGIELWRQLLAEVPLTALP